MPSTLESWVRGILWHVERGAPVEDSRVELKADWPTDSSSTARRLAGHANAARGELILWLIGVDERRGIVGAPQLEISRWYSRVTSSFAGPQPRLTDQILRYGHYSVAALLFATDESPYVIKNPVYGETRGGPVEREIPWREGTAVRSATREDLLQILIPHRVLPELTVEGATLRCSPGSFDFSLSVYIIPTTSDTVVLPWHFSNVEIKLPTGSSISLGIYYLGRNQESLTITQTQSEALVYGPGRLILGARSSDHEPPGDLPSDLIVEALIAPAAHDKAILIEVKLKAVRDHLYKLERAHVHQEWRGENPPSVEDVR